MRFAPRKNIGMNGPNNYLPHNALINLVLLGDDLIHKGLNKAADKVEEKTGFGRPMQVTCISVGTGIADAPIMAYLDKLRDPFNQVQLLGIPILMAGFKKFPQGLQLGGWPKDPVGSFAKVARIPFLFATGMFAYRQINGELAGSIPMTLMLLVTTISCYILSSSTGILDRAINYAKAMFSEMKPLQATLVNSRIGSETGESN